MPEDKYISVSTQTTQTATSVSIVTKYSPESDSDWILRDGYWLDEGTWYDDEVWID